MYYNFKPLVVILVSAQDVQNGGPILNLSALRGTSFSIYVLSKIYEFLFMSLCLLWWLPIIF